VLLEKNFFGLTEDVENELIEMIRRSKKKFKCTIDELLKSLE
jgi:hypothetical protein